MIDILAFRIKTMALFKRLCQSSGRPFYRYSSTCCPSTTTTKPIEASANTLRHLQFTPILPFEDGLQIQEKVVKAQLDIKDMQSKIRKKLEALKKEYEGSTINEHEQKILDQIMAMKPNPLLLTFEFQPTYTGGKRIKKSITEEQIKKYEDFVPTTQKGNPRPKYVQVERGGQITFHGPGQLVAYVILDLRTFEKFPAKCLVSSIEKATMNTLKNLEIDETGKQLNLKTKTTENTGVWTEDDKKIASIGIHVRRSITSHGVAINVNTDLSYMKSFEMCGLQNSSPTSLVDQTGYNNIDVQQVAIQFAKEFAKILGIQKVERIQITEEDVNAMQSN